MNDEWISISEVLADMERIGDDGRLHTFSIEFVRENSSSNGERGSIKRVASAAKYTKPGKKVFQPKRANTTSWQFKDHNALPIQDLTTGQMLTPKWTHLIKYNEQRIKHYG